ncbi:MAG: substrate-binding domain-containing protein [Candidatus Bathyarchaeia archaeon]
MKRRKIEDLMEEVERLSRREALSSAAKVAIGAIIAGVVAGVGGYLAGSQAAPAKTVTERVTVTQPGPAAVERTVTITETLLSTITSAAPGVKKPAEGMYFRLVTHGGDDPFWAVVKKGMMDAKELFGCGADIDLCGGDLALQQKRFKEAVAMKPTAIALVINDPSWAPLVQEALDQGVPVFGINNDWPGNPRLFYIGQNEIRAGYIIGKRIFETGIKKGIDPEKAHLVMPVEVPGAAYGVQRSTGILQAAEEYGIKSYEILDAGGLEMTTVEARETAYFLAHPETTFAIGLGGICTDRLTTALKNAGKKPGEIIAGGFDTTPGTLAGLKEGYMEATIDQQQYLQGYFAIVCGYLYAWAGFMPNIDTGGYLVDKNTIGIIEKFSPLYVR